MSVVVAVGVGASGSAAGVAVAAGLVEVSALGRVRGVSDRFENPAWGGVTMAPFVNAVTLIESERSLTSLLTSLFAIERANGRVRGQRNNARTLDLDILWSTTPVFSASKTTPSSSMTPSALTPTVPHPRLVERAFCVRPLVQALTRANIPVPHDLMAAAAALSTRTPMRAIAG